MSTGNIPHRVNHGEECQTKGQSHSTEADAVLREGGIENGSPTAAKYQPKGSKNSVQSRCFIGRIIVHESYTIKTALIGSRGWLDPDHRPRRFQF